MVDSILGSWKNWKYRLDRSQKNKLYHPHNPGCQITSVFHPFPHGPTVHRQSLHLLEIASRSFVHRLMVPVVRLPGQLGIPRTRRYHRKNHHRKKPRNNRLCVTDQHSRTGLPLLDIHL